MMLRRTEMVIESDKGVDHVPWASCAVKDKRTQQDSMWWAVDGQWSKAKSAGSVEALGTRTKDCT